MHSQQNIKICPKHVEFHSKNKSEKLVHLVGFIKRIYHNARSSECQNLQNGSNYMDCSSVRLMLIYGHCYGNSDNVVSLKWKADGTASSYSNGSSWTCRSDVLEQCFSTFVRPQPGKFFFHKTRARS